MIPLFFLGATMNDYYDTRRRLSIALELINELDNFTRDKEYLFNIEDRLIDISDNEIDLIESYLIQLYEKYIEHNLISAQVDVDKLEEDYSSQRDNIYTLEEAIESDKRFFGCVYINIALTFLERYITAYLTECDDLEWIIIVMKSYIMFKSEEATL